MNLERTMIGFGAMTFRVACIMGVLIATTLAAARWLAASGIGGGWDIALKGIAPSILSILVTVAMERSLSKKPFLECLADMGLGPPQRDQLAAGAASLLPIALAYALIFCLLHVPIACVPFLPLVMIKFLLAQGLAEELVFRGFVFRHLRVGRSWLRATTLSACLFGAVHLANFIHGVNWEMVIAIAISVPFAFLLAYPSAYLFERGGNVIWGYAIVHVGIDSINWFEHITEPGTALVVYLAAILASTAVTFWLGNKWLPAGIPRMRQPLPTPVGPTVARPAPLTIYLI